MNSIRLKHSDALYAFDLATQEEWEKYEKIRLRMKDKGYVSKEERSFVRHMRLRGRETNLKRAREGFDRLFS